MQNIDRAFQDIEVLTDNAYPYINKIKGIEFWKKNEHIHIFDLRMSYKLSDRHKLSLICSNLLNKAYSLRPLKIEAPRTTSIQYVFNF
jgi:hypothetical protein